MRFIPTLFLAVLLPAGVLFAQQTVNDINLDELRPPSSPGFSILGVQPTEISRPSSWRAFQTTLSNSFFQDNKVVIPKNFAMEFNPFFASRGVANPYSPHYAFMEAGENKAGKTMRDNFSISVATGEFKSYSDTSLTNPRMGIGMRTLFAQMKATDAARAVYFGFRAKLTATSQYNSIFTVMEMSQDTSTQQLVNIFNAKKDEQIASLKDPELAKLMTSIYSDYLQPVMQAALSSKKTPQQLKDTLEIAINNIPEYVAIKQSIEATKDVMGDKYGFAWEGAMAILLDFPTNDISFSKVPKFGLWTTGTYRSKNQHWEFGVLGRYINSGFEQDSKLNMIDLGGRAMLEGENWSVNWEYIQRFQWNILSSVPNANGQNVASVLYFNDFKMSLTANYKLTDNVIINYTFGNNFTVNTELTNGSGNILSTVGLVYAMGGPKVKDIAASK
jgi:hypothetical protein